MRKKLVALLAACALCASLLPGCTTGGGGSTSSATATGNTGGEKVLQVLWFSDGKEGETFRRLADQYEKENPGIKIEMVEVPFNDMNDKVKNMLAAKKPPALMRTTVMAQYADQLVDLRKYAKAGDAFADQFNTGGLKFIFKDKMIGAPMDITANGLVYNKTAFEKAGVKVPQSPDEIWTWEEWEAAMQTVMEKGGVKYGLVYDKTPFRFSTLIYQAGGSMLNDDLTKSNFTSPGVLRAVKFFKELHEKEIVPESVWLGSENPNNLFRTGQVAMHLGGSWLISNYRTEITDFEWGVTYMPKDAKRSTVPGGKYLAAFEGTGVEKEAAEFIEWLSKPEINAEYCKENYFLSQVKGNEKLDYDYGADFYEIFNNELAATSPVPAAEWGYQEFTSQISNMMRDSLAEVLSGALTPEEYVAQMDAKATEALKDLQK